MKMKTVPITVQDEPAKALAGDVSRIYIYRHLLRNIASKRRAIEVQQQKRAPRVKGPRAAAVLARLWADKDLGLDPTPQKVIAHELGIGESEVTKTLRAFRNAGSGAPCVTLVSDAYTRENLYEISEAGKQELENWILAYYTHDSFFELIRRIKPNTKNIAPMLTELRKEVRQRLGR